MNRRDFLRRAALIAAGAVAADQLDLIERLGWRRKLFPGWTAPSNHEGRYLITRMEQSFYPDRMSTVTIDMRGEGRAFSVTADAAAAHPALSRFLVGDWVQLSGSFLDA
jgi:hypothetical protein